MVFWILKSVNIQETIKVLQKTSPFYFLLAFILYNLSNIFLTIKWYRLANPLNIQSNFSELLRLNYISMFYSMFVPGQASGELIKGLKLVKKEESHEKVWIPIFIDKITNLLITFIIGFTAILFDTSMRQNKILLLVMSLLTGLLTLITIISFSEGTAKFICFVKDNLIKILKLLKINSEALKDFSLSYFESYKKHNNLMFETFLWSFLIKAPHILAFYVLALCLGIKLSLIQSAWLFSIVSVFSLLPISFSGLGVREGTVIVLFSQIGIESSIALSFSMLVFTIGVIIGLIGGVFELVPLQKASKANVQK